MKIGILNADDLEKHVIDKYGDYADMFCDLILNVDDTVQFRKYQVTHFEYPADIDECDAYLLTGSKFGAYEDHGWIKRLMEFIITLHKRQKKLIGICFGHQVIAQALGGLVEKSEKGWGVGLVKSEIQQPANEFGWLRPEKDSFVLLVSHQDQVIKLPPQAQLVASNDFCPVASFQVGQSMLAFQGHPEFSVEYLEYIMEGRWQLIGEEKYNQAKLSIEQPADQKLVTQWMLNFING